MFCIGEFLELMYCVVIVFNDESVGLWIKLEVRVLVLVGIIVCFFLFIGMMD